MVNFRIPICDGYLYQKKVRPLLSFYTFCLASLCAAGQPNTTLEYDQIIKTYQQLAAASPKVCQLKTAGLTDSGKPLHIFIIDPTGYFKATSQSERQMPVCMIMNGIHAGEPCGIDASIEFATEKVKNPDQNVVYCIIPVYNIGGSLHRNSHSRANQNGPESYGFRGNAKNLDLNRDFIKCDSRNSLSFSFLFHEWQPEIFIDTHTSNGSDYQPTLTLISPFKEKLDPMQAKFLEMELNPYLYKQMKEKGQEMVPYVNTVDGTPDNGIAAFTDLPRYSMGYASLFNTLAFTTEAHMLKPFDNRVTATLNFFETLSTFLVERGDLIVEMKRIADKRTEETTSFGYDWKIENTPDSIEFPGYTADYIISKVTGQKQLIYLQNEPYRKNVAYFTNHEAKREAKTPKYYVIPQGWKQVTERLDANAISYQKIKKDTTLTVYSTYVDSFKTVDYPYEGHYLHYETYVSQRKQNIKFYAGDYLVSTNQEGRRYLAQVFTAPAEDSFFNWGFFDSVLAQKEYFSDYVYDKTAEEILNRNANLRQAFEKKKAKDSAFAGNARDQLNYIYINSENYEITHKRLPVFEIRQ